MPNTYKKYKKKYNTTRKKLYILNGGGSRINLKQKQNKGENFEKISFSLLAARLFIETNKTFDEISKILQDKLETRTYAEFRNKLAGGNTDSECKKAAKIANNNSECKCIGFIDESERKKINYSYSNSKKNSKKLGNIQNDEYGTKWMRSDDNDRPKNSTGDKIGKIINRNNTKQPFTYRYKEAGDCWLCGEPVYFYFDGKNKTGCGECEHIGSIMPSLFAGMLRRQDLSAFIYNYGLSHVHCNQHKGNYTSMIFNSSNLKWEYDEQTTKKIVDKILKSSIHFNEYCPDFKDKLNDWKKPNKRKNQLERMMTLIYEQTDIWTEKANEQLNEIDDNVPGKKKKKNLTKFVQAIEYMVERSIKNAANYRSTKSKGGDNHQLTISNKETYVNIHNYYGLNIDVDDNKQINVEKIKKILEEIRKEINENPKNDFNEFLKNFKESVKQTRLSLINNQIRDVNESKEIELINEIDSLIEAEAQEAERLEAERLEAEAQEAAILEAARVKLANEIPSAFDTPARGKWRGRSLPRRVNTAQPEIEPADPNKRSAQRTASPRQSPHFVVGDNAPQGQITLLGSPTDRELAEIFQHDSDSSNVSGTHKRPSPAQFGPKSKSPRLQTPPVTSKGGKNKRKTRKKKRN